MAFESDIDVGFPFELDGRGRLTDPDYEQHVRQMIELVLFTAPGERVNRPDFGCGLLEQVFGREGEQEASITNFLVQGSLERWLGNVISVEAVEVVPQPEQGSLAVRIEYRLLRDEQFKVATFEARGLPWDL